MSSEAITRNEKLLRILREHLSQGEHFDVYKQATEKLVTWLGNRKAYYADVRPKVCVSMYNVVAMMLTVALVDCRSHSSMSLSFNRHAHGDSKAMIRSHS